ncbi:hypothetical protein DITRI_Ditri02bG0194200 [Diplodiscus trichospermus]
MEGVAGASPSSSTAAYVSWEEVNVSCDKGRRKVHYYLKRRDGGSDLAVIGKEKSSRYMSYHFVIKNRSLFFSSTSFYKLKSRREVVYWLNSVVSGFDFIKIHLLVSRIVQLMAFLMAKMLKVWILEPLRFFMDMQKKRKHYWSFQRNGVIISIHTFVYVLVEEDKRLVACVKDLYEDSNGNWMVVVRWFHKIDEIDGLATVLSPLHFKKFLNEATHTRLEPFVCCKQFENDDVMPFDVTQVKGYWKQDILRDMYSLSPSNDCVSRWQHADDQKTGWDVDDGVRIKPRKRYFRSKDDDAYMHYCGSRESMDASCADVQDFRNRKNGTKSFSFNEGSSAFPSTDEAKQYSSQHLKDAVDEANKLEEWVLASRVAVPDQVGICICGRTTIRPSSQYPKGSASCIGVGFVVDVWWHDGWWEGIVVEKDSEDKFHVYFPEKRESVFDGADVRQSQEWMGNRWINMRERHDLVSSILGRRKQDASKSYDCNLVKTACCDGGQSGKDAATCDDSPLEPGNDCTKDVSLVPDLSKDDLLSQLKWKPIRKRKRVTATCVQKTNYVWNLIKNTTGPVTCERFLIPASLKIDYDTCKYLGDPLFCSSVVSPLTSLVMTR